MSRLSKSFNKFIDAWIQLKTAKEEFKSGNISNGELFDIEFNAFELEEKFIEQIKKIK
tara:strand:- start:818 stop:991 length:174 start_codon:yes stop_codon:yes gene_type:complete